MAEKAIPITWPSDGLVEAWSFSDQPANSARECQNVRVQDPTNGRLRGAQRSGLTKYVTSVMKASGTKVSEIVSFVVDNRQVEYTAIASGSETVTWDEPTPSGGNCRNVKVDRQGNVYALDGNAALVKFSADGNKLWQLAIPVADPQHVVRALALDEFDNIYLGVSAGGVQDTAKLWAYRQLVDNTTEVLWEMTPGAYTEEIKIVDGRLYAAQNRPDRKRSHVRVYDFAGTIDPSLSKEWRVPHPCNSLAVKADGAVIVACEPSGDLSGFYQRSPDPRYPNLGPDSVVWMPEQLSNSAARIWGWWKGDSIDQTDVVSDLAEGVEISRWRDSTKNLRHWYADFTAGDGGPVLALDGLQEHKGIRFNKTSTTQPLQSLKTLPNSSKSIEFADQQRTSIPTYSNSMFGLFIACRPSASANSNGLAPSWVWGQDRDDADSGADDHILFINANDNNSTALAPSNGIGRVYWFTGENVTDGDGTGGNQILDGSFISNNFAAGGTNAASFTLISALSEGAVSGNTIPSLFSINGNPIDSFSNSSCQSLSPSYLGVFRSPNGTLNPTTGVHQFLGDVLEILSLDRRNRTSATSNVITADNLEIDSGAASQTINEKTCIEGYFMHKYGAQASLPRGSAATNNYPHPFGYTGSGQDVLSGPPGYPGTNGAVAVSTAQALANKRWGCVVKYSADGRIVWCANEQELISGDRSGGYGYAVAVNSDGNIYSFGPTATGTGSDDSSELRMIVDQGSDFSINTGDGAWSVELPFEIFPIATPRMDVDEFDNLYVPTNNGVGGGGSILRVYDSAGAELHAHTISASTGISAVAVDRRIPDYRTDIDPKRAEHVFLGMLSNGSDLSDHPALIFKLRLVESTQVAGATRSLISLAASGGDINVFTTSAVTTPTGGSGALDSDARYVQGTTMFKRAYFTDGRQVKQYDPVENEVSELKSLSAGALPSRCALIEQWRGRLVLARSADDPHNWFLSKKDDPTNWDFFPPVPTEVDAVSGSSSIAGLCPDIINSVVPYSEDILVFGGDHSIWMLVGDPAAGGRLELVSDVTGMAFGRPWAKDPNGVLYFVGSRGGLFRWSPGAKPERISLYKIERQLQEIDFSTYYVRLIWNYQDEGLHIIQCPFGAGGTQVDHWFWEQKSNSFSKDIFGASAYTNVQPTAVHVIDGDEFDDRLLLFGCEDGYVRKWDKAAKSDDTRTDGTTKQAIDALVTIFPIQAPEALTGMETEFKGLTVILGDADAGCRYELFSSDEPDSLGIARRAGNLGPGRNAPRWDKVTGAYCGLRLRNAAAEERFSLERAYIYASPAGQTRPRAVN